MSECDFGGSINGVFRVIEEGVLAVSTPIRPITTVPYQYEDSLHDMTAATLVHVNGTQYLYAALSTLNSGKIVKVIR